MVDGEKQSARGREILENVLIDKSFLRQNGAVRMLTDVPSFARA